MMPTHDWTIPPTATGPVIEDRSVVLLYVHTGTATIETAGTVRRLAAGEAVWVPPGIPHRTRADAGAVVLPIFPRSDELPEALTTTRTITVPPTWARWLVQRHVDDCHLAHDVQDALPDTGTLLGMIARAPSSDDERWTGAEALRLPVSHAALSTARTLLRDPGTPMSLTSFAARESVSVKTLQRQFHRETGLAFADWRSRARVVAAARHLAAGRTVGWTGRHVGYATPAGFTKAFRRLVGLTPRAYAGRARERSSATRTAPDAVVGHVAALAAEAAPEPPAVAARRTWTRVNGEHVLLWMYCGEADVRVGSRDIRLRAGHALWLPAGVPNAVEGLAGSVAVPLGYSHTPVGLDVDDLSVLSFPPEAQDFLLHTSLVSYTLFQPARRRRSFVEELFRAQFIADRDTAATAGLTGAVGTVTRAMRRDPSDARSLLEWAAHLGTSPRELGREFLSQTGETFPRWRAQHRMDIARWLLCLGDPPGQVAKQLGYSSAAAFTNAFTTAHGMSPSEHQRREGDTSA
ncbi:helix-turn-helix domain-containing protein [Nocardioides humi]|uniref:helix-turn-helix domain-containing protein n=1 Tax=Nocardioides humi TaxID=449461 RepID=UPI0015E867E5|nr:helix-turn-helix domain-containing protein [Nocardioides humi]